MKTYKVITYVDAENDAKAIECAAGVAAAVAARIAHIVLNDTIVVRVSDMGNLAAPLLVTGPKETESFEKAPTTPSGLATALAKKMASAAFDEVTKATGADPIRREGERAEWVERYYNSFYFSANSWLSNMTGVRILSPDNSTDTKIAKLMAKY